MHPAPKSKLPLIKEMFSITSKVPSVLYKSASFSRLSSTLAFIETSPEGKVLQSSLSALNAANQLGNPISALVVGSNANAASEEVRNKIKCGNLNKIIVAKNAAYDNFLPEMLTPLCTELLRSDQYSHFIISSSSVGKNVLPRIGALLDYQPICDITKIVDANTFVRPIYAGNALATVKCPQDKKLISIRSSSFPSIEEGVNEAEIVDAPPMESSPLGTQWEGASLVKNERPDLGSATRIVSGGRGLKNKETFERLVTPLADSLHAAIGATRAAVDAGFCDNSLQIGQTGKVVAPDLYIAVGISGAIQHLAGMKDSKTIVAINNDPEAPIFQVADFGLVGDLNEIVPELTQKITK